MQFTDTVVLDGVRKTRDGYLVAEVPSARVGIQLYAGREVDPDNQHGFRDRAVVRVYRPPEEVFSDAAMSSMTHRPVTVGHPAEFVDAKNWKKLAGGMTGGETRQTDKVVRVPMVLMDQGAIDAYEAGHRELSWGYTSNIEFADGKTADGEQYDAVQRDIRANHLAVVHKARGGPELRIGDDKTTPEGGRTVATKMITFDGLPIEVTDAGEAAINKLKGMLDASATALETAKTAHTTALAAKDTELATKDAEIEKLKAQVVDGAALDKLVAERADVVTRAKALDAKVVTDGKSNLEIKRAVLGDAVKDKSDDYVNAAFDLKTSDGQGDKIRDAIRDGVDTKDADKAVADARQGMLDDLHGKKAAA